MNYILYHQDNFHGSLKSKLMAIRSGSLDLGNVTEEEIKEVIKMICVISKTPKSNSKVVTISILVY